MKADKFSPAQQHDLVNAKLVVARWIDIHSSDPWEDRWPIPHDPFVVESSGWLLNSEDGVIIVPNRHCPSPGHETPAYYGRSHIPSGCILSVHEIPTSRIKNYGK